MGPVKRRGPQTRSRIVESASHGLRQRGADSASLADLMKLAGLTRGGFYFHFESREALVNEACALAMDQTLSHWLEIVKATPPGKRFDVVVASYLSHRHRDDWAHGCVLPALGADMARSGEQARRVFAGKLDEMIDAVARLFPEKSLKQERQIAAGALATMAGSVILARAIRDKELSSDILAAGRQALRHPPAARRARR
jgi:TetR/AcrR family transcriptional regulator, transcriptional repressor for nem operon